MNVQSLPVWVGESIPVRFTFLSRLRGFSGQALVGASINWVSMTPAVATFNVGSEALVTSTQAAAEGISNDAVIGRFTAAAAGLCTVMVSVQTTNPTATYIGVAQLNIEAIPTP